MGQAHVAVDGSDTQAERFGGLRIGEGVLLHEQEDLTTARGHDGERQVEDIGGGVAARDRLHRERRLPFELLLGVLELEARAAPPEHVDDAVVHRGDEVRIRPLLRPQQVPAAPDIRGRLGRRVASRLAVEGALGVIEHAPMDPAIHLDEELLELEGGLDRHARWRDDGDQRFASIGLGPCAFQSHAGVGGGRIMCLY